MSALWQQLNGEIAGIIEAAGRSLVKVRHSSGNGAGAGIIVHADGLILTNAHVIHHRSFDVVLADERSFPAKVLVIDSERDLAALSVNAHHLPSLELGDSKKLRPGTLVFALGHPWGVRGAVSAGSVIAVGPPPELATSREFIQSDLQLRPGHSGGPMVDTSGRVVGVNTLITGPKVGLAIPVHVVNDFLHESLKV